MNHWKLRKPIVTLLLATVLLCFASVATAAPQEEPATEEISLWSAALDTVWDFLEDLVFDDDLETTQTQSNENTSTEDGSDAGMIIDPMG